MKNLKKGNFVVRKSHNKDILFIIKNIIKKDSKKIALLNGLTIRIIADAPIEDLEIVAKEDAIKEINRLNEKLEKRIEKKYNNIKTNDIRYKKIIQTGKILHLDGDRKYTDKSYKYYKKMGLNAIVKYIPEYKQPIFIKNLLDRYNPDILVITRT